MTYKIDLFSHRPEIVVFYLLFPKFSKIHFKIDCLLTDGRDRGNF